ncbi:hypothetical protein DDE18_05055 [Nocardioides gansuensis]|uniref:LppX_LprAFG lipoprotein n=1 Tax=Nocardioides gansuensis TaxID=2138300 RepID=A0A2T8FDB6_9ACTN|nr:LppX_LprAFG lipoprotein [Nocardioides gansuensis]PVG83693.1 hypothetical protein DDE18_05055 [Nocardioides gansuensis]
MPAARLALLVPLAVLALTACTGGGEEPVSEEQTPEEVLAGASDRLSETSGVQLSLRTAVLPPGVTGVTRAEGVATNAPAFDGTLTVVFAGQNVEVPVIAVDDTVHAKIPFTTGWSKVDPADYGAPDPADLVDPATGFPALLTQTKDLEEGESVRGGADNSEVLTTYTGTVPGSAVQQVIPSSSGDSFDVEYLVSAEGELRKADLTGVFYPGSEEMTYTVSFEDYDTSAEIVAP